MCYPTLAASFPKEFGFVLKSTIFMLKHERTTPGCGQLEGSHQILLSNECLSCCAASLEMQIFVEWVFK